MILKTIDQNKLIGFSFYPLLEISLGVFFLFIIILIPILYYKYNGFNLKLWDEWLMILVFCIFFFFLGKSLTFQNMKVRLKNNIIFLYQNMRNPSVNLEIELKKINDILLIEETINDENMFYIKIRTDKEDKYFYQTRSEKEANEINNYLKRIFVENKGDKNGPIN